jgi:Protein of unknown function (DUF2934)
MLAALHANGAYCLHAPRDCTQPLLGCRFGLRPRAHARKLTPTFTQEDLMATRRPTEPPRSPDLSKEIPNVIKADEKLAPKAPRVRAKDPAAKASTAVAVSEDVRRGMIAEGAYLRAERRGFAPGYEAQDWLDAEAEVDALLKARAASTSQ